LINTSEDYSFEKRQYGYSIRCMELAVGFVNTRGQYGVEYKFNSPEQVSLVLPFRKFLLSSGFSSTMEEIHASQADIEKIKNILIEYSPTKKADFLDLFKRHNLILDY